MVTGFSRNLYDIIPINKLTYVYTNLIFKNLIKYSCVIRFSMSTRSWSYMNNRIYLYAIVTSSLQVSIKT